MSYLPPLLSPKSLTNFLKTYFPFQTVDECSIEQLEGYEDRNYYFVGILYCRSITSCLSNSSQFVIKFLNANDSVDTEMVDGITKITKFLHQRKINCPCPMPSSMGSDIVIIKHSELLLYSEDQCNEKCNGANNTVQSHSKESSLADGHHIGNRQYCARVFVFVEGETLGYDEQSFDLLHELGCYIGRMNREMMDFAHDVLERRELFEIHLLKSRKETVLNVIKDTKRQMILHDILNDFETFVVPFINDPNTIKGFIHNDIHGGNIITKRDSNGDLSINGIIDFSDCVYSPYVIEIGIAMAYLMMRTTDPINYVKPLLHGYLSVNQLSDKSLDVLFYVILGRLAQACINAHCALMSNSSNAEYIMSDVAPGWDIIELLLREGKQKCYQMWVITQPIIM